MKLCKEDFGKLIILLLIKMLVFFVIFITISYYTYHSDCQRAVKDCIGKDILSICHYETVTLTDVKHCFK